MMVCGLQGKRTPELYLWEVCRTQRAFLLLEDAILGREAFT